MLSTKGRELGEEANRPELSSFLVAVGKLDE